MIYSFAYNPPFSHNYPRVDVVRLYCTVKYITLLGASERPCTCAMSHSGQETPVLSTFSSSPCGLSEVIIVCVGTCYHVAMLQVEMWLINSPPGETHGLGGYACRMIWARQPMGEIVGNPGQDRHLPISGVNKIRGTAGESVTSIGWLDTFSVYNFP